MNLSRRSFVKLLSAGSLGVLGVACAPAAPATPTSAAATSAPVVLQNPRADLTPQPTLQPGQVAQGAGGPAPAPKGNRLVVGMPRPAFQGNDPNRAAAGDAIANIMYETGLGMDPITGTVSGDFVPQLFERKQIEPNGTDFRFFLRKGVQVHNGFGELTADDVVLGVQDAIAPGITDSAFSQELRDMIANVEVINPYEVLFHMKVPQATLEFFLSQTVGALAFLSKKDYDSRGGKGPATRDPVTPPLAGTGPYQFKSRTPDLNIVFQHVPYKHWRQDADFQELEVRYYTDLSTRLQALLSGEIHMTTLTRDNRDLAISRGYKVFRGKQPGIMCQLVLMGSYLNNPDDPSSGYKFPNSPIMNAKVRQAMTRAIDRNALNKLFKGEGYPEYLAYRAEWLEGWDDKYRNNFANMYGYDPAAAKQLLADAGYGPGNPATITLENIPVPFVPEAADVLEAISQMWRAVGINAPIETLDFAAYTTKQRNLEFDSHVYVYGIGQAQNWSLPQSMTAHRQNRGVGFENYEYETMFYDMVHTLDVQARNKKLIPLGDWMYNNFMFVPLFWLYNEVVADPKVVADFTFPGTSASFYSFLSGVKAA